MRAEPHRSLAANCLVHVRQVVERNPFKSSGRQTACGEQRLDERSMHLPVGEHIQDVADRLLRREKRSISRTRLELLVNNDLMIANAQRQNAVNGVCCFSHFHSDLVMVH